MSSEDREESQLLDELIRKELANVPIEHWGYFFPCQVAVWRFIESRRPGVLGELHAGFDKEPYFKGRGADWFCGTLGNQDAYLTLLEEIMYPLVTALSPEIRDRGYLLGAEVPQLDREKINRLTSVVLAEADAVQQREIPSS